MEPGQGRVGHTDAMKATEHPTTQNSTLTEWTQALAQSTGSPGGGAGAGVMLAIAASLMSMVAGYTDSKEQHHGELARVHERAQSLRTSALELADRDAEASDAFGSAFNLDPGEDRERAIRSASVKAAKASAQLGELALSAIDDLQWLSKYGNQALIADVVVSLGSLRAALAGARTNVSFDLSVMTSGGMPLEEVRERHGALWATVHELAHGIERLDDLSTHIDDQAAPTAAE